MVLNLFNKYVLCVEPGLNGDCSRHSAPTSKSPQQGSDPEHVITHWLTSGFCSKCLSLCFFDEFPSQNIDRRSGQLFYSLAVPEILTSSRPCDYLPTPAQLLGVYHGSSTKSKLRNMKSAGMNNGVATHWLCRLHYLIPWSLNFHLCKMWVKM